MKPFALVLAGGGAKGAYEFGAWKAMREIGVTFNAIAGASIGSINGALIAADDYINAEKFWNTASISKGIKTDEPLPDPENFFARKNWSVLFKEFLKNKGFDASPVKEFLAQFINEEKVRKSGMPFGIVTVQMTQGISPKELYLSDIPDGQLLDYLLASANVPLANNIGPEGEKFLDGGIYDNIPVSMLKRIGYNRLVVVDISSIKGVSHETDFVNCQVVYIRPYNIDELGSAHDFNEDVTKRRILLGYLDARKAFGYLSGNIYYFTPNAYLDLVKEFGAKETEKLEETAYTLKVKLEKVYSKQEFLTEIELAVDKHEEAVNLQKKEKEPFLNVLKNFIEKLKDD